MPSKDPWKLKTHLGGIPLAPIETLEQVYGRGVRRMSRPQFLTYCQERSAAQPVVDRRGGQRMLSDENAAAVASQWDLLDTRQRAQLWEIAPGLSDALRQLAAPAAKAPKTVDAAEPTTTQLRWWLEKLPVKRLRELAVDMRYRWESRRVELIDFMVERRPATALRAYAEAHGDD